MKKLLYTIFAAAAVFAAAGCARETLPGEGEVDATFNVGFAESATKAVSDGLTATQLVVGVYDKATGYVSSLSKPTASADPNAFTALKATFSARLVKGHGYDIVFIAQAPGNTAYTIDLAGGTFTVNPAGLSNDETRDAFYSVYSIDKVEDAVLATVTLKRPFAQLNVIDLKADYEAAVAAGVNFSKSALKITAPTVMNLLDGTVGTPAEYDFAANEVAVSQPDFEPYKAAGDYWLLCDYILAGTSTANHDITFSFYEAGATAPLFTQGVANVPLQRNYRTNLYGNLLTTDGDFSIIIEPQYDGMNDVAIGDGEIPAVTMTDTTLPAAGSTVTAEVGGTINFAAVHPIATIKPTYASSNTTVGTISAEGLFTALSAGTTDITIAFPQVENGVAKATNLNYAAYTLKYTVKVGEVAVAVDPTLEVTGVPTAAVEAGASFEMTVTTNSTGAVSVDVAPTGAATVTPGTVAGKYTVKASEPDADTQVTLTVAVAAVPDAFNAASKEVKFTVSKKGEEPAVDLSGNYVLAVKVDDAFIAVQSSANGTRIASKAITYTGTGDLENVAANLVWTVAKTDAGYSVKGSAGYISWAKDNTADLSETAYDLSITASETAGTYNIISVADATRKFQYNKASNAQYFAFYTSAQVGDFYLIKATASTEPVVETAEITVSPTLTVKVGGTAQISATTNSTATITYTSATPAVATVSETGLVTGVAAGTAVITVAVPAVDGAFTAASKEVTVTVSEDAWTFDFSSNVKYEAGDNSLIQAAKLNGSSEETEILKLATSSKAGSGIIYVKKGSTKLTMYAAAWNGVTDAEVVFSQNGTEIGKITPSANTGVASSSPYTVTVAQSDFYTLNLNSDAPIAISSAKRAILFAVQCDGTGDINIPESGLKFKKVTAIESGKSYAIVGVKDGKYYAANVVSGNYGYPGGKECTLNGEFITTDLSAQLFTFTTMDGGYSIKQPDGKFWTTAGTYRSVQLAEAAAAWTVEAQADGTFKITSSVNNYILQHGNGTYTTFGVSDAADYGTLPYLYELVQ